MSNAEFYLSLYGDPYGVPGTQPDMPLLDAMARMQAVNGMVAITVRGLQENGWDVAPLAITSQGGSVMLADRTFPTTAEAEEAEQATSAAYRQQGRVLGLGEYIDALGTPKQDTPAPEAEPEDPGVAEWTTTGSVNTGSDPVDREWEHMPSGRRVWSSDPDGPSAEDAYDAETGLPFGAEPHAAAPSVPAFARLESPDQAYIDHFVDQVVEQAAEIEFGADDYAEIGE